MIAKLKQSSFALWLLFPSLVFLFAFTYLPFGVAFVDSLYDSRMASDGAQFVLFENYARLFADSTFYKALFNNIVLILLTVIPSIALALLLALGLQANTRTNRILRTIFFMPTTVPLVAAAALWIFIFLPGIGLIDYYLTRFLDMNSHNFLGNSQTALMALAVLTVWKFAGYYMIFFIAGLQAISESTLEAARLEGANAFQAFYYVTLPLLRPTISFVATIATIYAVTQVDHIMLMTKGGPDNSTNILLYYIFTTAQDSFDLGKASAATVVTLLGLLVTTRLTMNVLEKGAHYEQ